MASVTRRVLYFTGPRQIALREEELEAPGPGQVLVHTLVSAISPGTEMLIYRGQMPRGLAVDETIPALAGRLEYPLTYGYAMVGRVVRVGPGVDTGWKGQLVFAFHPHASHFLAPVDTLHPLPPTLSPEEALFLPNVETAVNFLMDGRPLIGERVVIFGQGVVGLLTTALLARYPLDVLIALDPLSLRRAWALRLGAHAALDPTATDAIARVREHLAAREMYAGADLVYEVSGNPAALGQALEVVGFSGRVVIGSWYGEKQARLDLGGRSHRSRARLISSQVSTMAPEFGGLWTKKRRLQVAWRMVEAIRPARLITHRVPAEEAAAAYALIDTRPEETLQVILVWDEL